MPKVSIVISSYNHAQFISQTIDSILAQSFQDFEVIIFDDCSSDNSVKVIEAYQSPKIKLHKAPYNRGMVTNINEAISLAKGEYVANMNSDDYWHKDKLLKQVQFLETYPQYSAVFTDAHLVNERGKIIKTSCFKYFDNVHNKSRYEWLEHWFYHGNCVCYPSVMVRKECYDKVGLYNPAYVVLLDFDMWIRICLAGNDIYLIKEKLTYFRLLDKRKNLGRRPNQSLSVLEHDYVMRNYLNIASKEEFLKIFPYYDRQKLQHNAMQDCLLDLVNSQYFNYLNKQKKSKEDAKFLKKLANLKETFAMRFLVSQIHKEPKTLMRMKENFGVDFQAYLAILHSCNIHQKDFASFSKNITRNVFRVYLVLTTSFSIALLYLLIKT